MSDLIEVLTAAEARNISSNSKLQKILQDERSKEVYDRITAEVRRAADFGANEAGVYLDEEKELDVGRRILWDLNYKIERVGVFMHPEMSIMPKDAKKIIGVSFSW